MFRRLLFVGIFWALLTGTSVMARDVSVTVHVPGYDANPAAVNAAVFDDNWLTLDVMGLNADNPIDTTMTCVNLETGETETISLRPLAREATNNGVRYSYDIATTWLGLPYPADAWALESKPLAIIAGRVAQSPARLTQAEIRSEFAWTAAYMLETARHSYGLPLGDGALDCTFEVITDTATASTTLRVDFGRGLPNGVHARDFSTPDVSTWHTWLVSDGFAPTLPPLSDNRAALIADLLALQESRTPERVAQVRHFDDGAAVGVWLEAAMSAVVEELTIPPRAARVYGLVSVAMYDALVASSGVDAPEGWQPACVVEPTLQPLAPNCEQARHLPEHAVAAGAASVTLSHLYPHRTDEYTQLAAMALESRMVAGLSTADELAAGLAFGEAVGELAVQRALTDGTNTVFSGEIPVGDNHWIPALPDFAGPMEPTAATWRTWNLTSPDQYRPAPPPTFGTAAFEAQMQEVYAISENLTLEQEMIASYWEDKKGTYAPAGHWVAIALDLVREEGLNSTDAARVMAVLGTAQADAFIAAWDAKYAYWSIRPITAIQRTTDPDWKPYVYTPPFPSYVSGHATTSGAASTVLAAMFPAHAEQMIAWGEEGAMSRLYGGIHFRIDNDTGLALGQSVAAEALAAAGVE